VVGRLLDRFGGGFALGHEKGGPAFAAADPLATALFLGLHDRSASQIRAYQCDCARSALTGSRRRQVLFIVHVNTLIESEKKSPRILSNLMSDLRAAKFS
jgi:hypothetical protein